MVCVDPQSRQTHQQPEEKVPEGVWAEERKPAAYRDSGALPGGPAHLGGLPEPEQTGRNRFHQLLLSLMLLISMPWNMTLLCISFWRRNSRQFNSKRKHGSWRSAWRRRDYSYGKKTSTWKNRNARRENFWPLSRSMCKNILPAMFHLHQYCKNCIMLVDFLGGGSFSCYDQHAAAGSARSGGWSQTALPGSGQAKRREQQSERRTAEAQKGLYLPVTAVTHQSNVFVNQA